MAVTYNDAVKNARLDVVLAAIDAGSGAGDLQIATSSGFGNATDILVTFDFDDPAGTVGTDTLTFSNLPVSALADFTGTANLARIRDSDANVIIDGLTVGTSSTDVVLNTTSIESGQLVRIDSGTITHG